MTTLYQKIQRVESLQRAIDREIKTFRMKTGLDCINHCSECCKYDGILATSLEFLPFAWHAFKLGQLDYWFNELGKQEGRPNCVFYRSSGDNWGCPVYPSRGLICRLFGFSATMDKNGKPAFAACKVLKHEKPDLIKFTRELADKNGRIPVMTHKYQLLADIDPVSGSELMPINRAIRKALETIYFHFIYGEGL